LSLICNAPGRLPAGDGLKTTVIKQVAPGAIVAQILVCEKSPVAVTAETTSGAVPLFESVTPCDVEAVPI
jgi:hypothetical protein